MEKNRYSDAELSEFKALITEKMYWLWYLL